MSGDQLSETFDSQKIKLNSIEEAIEDVRQGKIIIAVDDEDRENEGDFIVAAELINPEIVNFMTKFGRGLICVSLTEERCRELDLSPMVGQSTAIHSTSFTVSVDKIGDGCTTGISAIDRSKTIQALVSPDTKPEDLGRPGHIFPLIAKNRGVLQRAGHTEAAVDLSRIAGLHPSGVLVEIMNDDGTMARLPELLQIAKQFDIKIITIQDLIAYRLRTESLIEVGVSVKLPTKYGDFRLVPFLQKSNGLEHIALIKGTWEKNQAILVRVHSSCVTGDIFGSLRCDCGDQLHTALKLIEQEGCGVLVYMMQEGRGIGLFNKMKAYKLQEQGFDTVDANIELGFQPDERDYGVGAQILKSLGIQKMKLLTNNPRKRVGLEAYGLEIVENVPIIIKPNKYNSFYLQTKSEKLGHFLEVLKQ